MFASSKVRILSDENSTEPCSVLMDELSFFNSSWQLFSVNLTIRNCHIAFSMLDVRYSTNVRVENSTFGFWTFTHVQQIVIINCSSNFNPMKSVVPVDEGPITSLIFYNSSGLIENINIKNINLDHIFYGIIVEYYSNIQITKSNFTNNAVNYTLFAVLNCGTLIMADSIVQRNQAKYYGATILFSANSSMNLTNTHFNDNKAVDTGGAIYAANNSILQIRNCTFQNNQVELGFGGAIHLRNKSRAEINNSYFTQNMATHGSAIFGILSCTLSCKNCLFYQNIIQNNTDAAAIQIYNFSTLNIIDLKCKRQMGKFLSCISASHYCKVFVYNSTFAINTGSVIVLKNNTNLVTGNSTFFNNSSPEYVGSISSNNSTLFISDSVFYHNEAKTGGALSLDLSVAKLNNCIVYNNSNTAFTLSNKTNISIENCVFQSNSSPDSGGVLFMYENCILNVSNTIFLHNSAVNEGTVTALGHSLLLMSNCTFSWNSALFYMSNVHHSKIYGAGGVIFIKNSNLIILQSQFSNNHAGKGGSVYCINSSLVIQNSIFESNITSPTVGVNASSVTFSDVIHKKETFSEYGAGGVIVIVGWSVLQSYQSQFKNNFAFYAGGSVYSTQSSVLINDSLFENNTASLSGGAMSSFNDSTVIIEKSLFVNNSVQSKEEKNRGVASGGAISIFMSVLKSYESHFFSNFAIGQGGSIFSYESSLFLTGSVFDKNIAASWHGVMVTSNFSSTTVEDNTFINTSIWGKNINKVQRNNTGSGGAIFIFQSHLKTNHSLFSNNNADVQGGSVYSSESFLFINGSVFKNNIAGLLGGAIMAYNQSFITMEDSQLINNSVLHETLSKGGALAVNRKCIVKIFKVHLFKNIATSGGTIFGSNLCKITIFNSSLSDNIGSGIQLEGQGDLQIGGCQFVNNSESAVYGLSECKINVTDTEFMYNKAVNGGCFYISVAIILFLHNCSFTNNFAQLNGGAIYAGNSDIKIFSCNFTRNYARMGNGGVGYLGENSQIKISTSAFRTNLVIDSGGVFCVRNSTVSVWNSTFVQNQAATGGVIDAQYSSFINMSQTYFLENKAITGGVLGGKVRTKVFVSDSIIQQNSAEECGVITLDTHSAFEISWSKVHQNSAKLNSGALCIFGNSLFIAISSSFKENMANDAGSIIISKSPGYMENCTLTGNQGTKAGAISISLEKLKLSNTVFLENIAPDIMSRN